MESNGAYDWLTGCEGFRVDAPSRRLGRVAEIHRDPDSGTPQRLVVRAGMFGMHQLDVPVDDIAGIVLSEHLIVLEQAPAS